MLYLKPSESCLVGRAGKYRATRIILRLAVRVETILRSMFGPFAELVTLNVIVKGLIIWFLAIGAALSGLSLLKDTIF